MFPEYFEFSITPKTASEKLRRYYHVFSEDFRGTHLEYSHTIKAF